MKNENLEMIRSDVLRINQSTKRIETNISKFNKKYELSAIPQIEPEIEGKHNLNFISFNYPKKEYFLILNFSIIKIRN